jgi:hypothetical protein
MQLQNDSLTLSEAAATMLTELAEQNSLAPSAVVEILVRQAHASKWGVTSSEADSILKPEKAPDEALDFEVLGQVITTKKGYNALVAYLTKNGIETWQQLEEAGYQDLMTEGKLAHRFIKILQKMMLKRNLFWRKLSHEQMSVLHPDINFYQK